MSNSSFNSFIFESFSFIISIFFWSSWLFFSNISIFLFFSLISFLYFSLTLLSSLFLFISSSYFSLSILILSSITCNSFSNKSFWAFNCPDSAFSLFNSSWASIKSLFNLAIIFSYKSIKDFWLFSYFLLFSNLFLKESIISKRKLPIKLLLIWSCSYICSSSSSIAFL